MFVTSFDQGRFLYHGGIAKEEALKMIVEHLEDDPKKAMDEVDKTRGSHARFEFLRKIYLTEI